MIHKLFFNIHGFRFQVESEWSEILLFLEKEYYFFTTIPFTPKIYRENRVLLLKITSGFAPKDFIPEIVAKINSERVQVYKLRHKDFIHYADELEACYDHKQVTADIFSANEYLCREFLQYFLHGQMYRYLGLRNKHFIRASAYRYKAVNVIFSGDCKRSNYKLIEELSHLKDFNPMATEYLGLDWKGQFYLLPRDDRDLDWHQNKNLALGPSIFFDLYALNSNHSYISPLNFKKSWTFLLTMMTKRKAFSRGNIAELAFRKRFFWIDLMIFLSRAVTMWCFFMRSECLNLLYGKNLQKAAKEVAYFLDVRK